jgi:hypothetical protein
LSNPDLDSDDAAVHGLGYEIHLGAVAVAVPIAECLSPIRATLLADSRRFLADSRRQMIPGHH